MKQGNKPQSMLEEISGMPSPKELIRQGSLPESCEVYLETALAYSEDVIKLLSSEFDVNAAFLAAKVVKQNLEKIKEKVEDAKK